MLLPRLKITQLWCNPGNSRKRSALSSNLTFVLGGAASGKSAYAEALALSLNRPLVYLATAEVRDAEMRQKVADHITRRGDDWTVVEAPMDAAEHLLKMSSESVCLFDCATMWLSNQMLAQTPLKQAEDDLLAAMESTPARLIVVSNEVGQGIVPENALSRSFREAQGRLNIRLAERADTVVLVTAGLPQALKGRLA